MDLCEDVSHRRPALWIPDVPNRQKRDPFRHATARPYQSVPPNPYSVIYIYIERERCDFVISRILLTRSWQSHFPTRGIKEENTWATGKAERERLERERYTYMYTYIYIYTYVCMHAFLPRNLCRSLEELDGAGLEPRWDFENNICNMVVRCLEGGTHCIKILCNIQCTDVVGDMTCNVN